MSGRSVYGGSRRSTPRASRVTPGDKMTDEDREWARRAAAGLPPLTEGQRDILALLLSRRR